MIASELLHAFQHLPLGSFDNSAGHQNARDRALGRFNYSMARLRNPLGHSAPLAPIEGASVGLDDYPHRLRRESQGQIDLVRFTRQLEASDQSQVGSA